MADWAEVGKVGGVGFATVIVVLSVLAMTLWVLGLVLKHIPGSDKNEKKGE